ncbi:phage holin family protein [Pedobacter duraquae]|uniref:Putative membrane protein n=1 Tax=Pedobacter duraquae TaxID=425511 RepID=A0A4R6IQH0_9SPHI|nr:phage holin family protein [Pedobacter duraquae]TDO24447.1 putative membrane protein [Pedobacter duraquae]
MLFILSLLLNAAVLLGLSTMMSTVTIKNYTTGIIVALVIGLLNATIGFIISFPINVITFGILSFVVHLVVTALMIKLADYLLSDFKVVGFKPALIIAVVMAFVDFLLMVL